MTENAAADEKTQAISKKRLPVELDNDTAIFSYGSLLDHDKLRALLKNRTGFNVLETGEPKEAVKMVRENPGDIVILTNVRLENVRVRIVTETILRRWFIKRGGNLHELFEAGITTPEIPQALFLYARPAKPAEKGKSLNGGIICNLSQTELANLDKYEWQPILKRTRVPELMIGNEIFVPRKISFYAGTESADDITREEKAERSKLLDLNRKPARQSPQAKWKRSVRRK